MMLRCSSSFRSSWLWLTVVFLVGCPDNEADTGSSPTLTFVDAGSGNNGPPDAGGSDIALPDDAGPDVPLSDVPVPDGDQPDGDQPDGDQPDGDQPDGDVPDSGPDTSPECVVATDCVDLEFPTPCFKGACIDGACEVVAADGDPCDDGDACTGDGTCVESECVAPAIVCDDSNPCTDDACDGGDCTATDNGTCTCDETSDCATWNDANLCNGSLACVENQCVVDPSTVVTCDPSEDPCQVVSCATDTGECVTGPAETGTTCDDDDACTQDDQCTDGACAGTALPCDDDNPCTDDGCVDGDCTFESNTAPCDDGALCTATDTCADGSCAGTPVVCDDGNPCTDDSCNPDTGECVSTPSQGACDDGNPCTDGDTCQDGACVPGTSTCQCTSDDDCVSMEDGNACNGTLHCIQNSCVVDPETVVTCPAASGPCKTPTCNPADGACSEVDAAPGSACDDGNPCTWSDVCSNAGCAGSPKTCDDDNLCTDDACNGDTGDCEFTPNTVGCDDGNACTTGDVCGAGQCAGVPKFCGDGNECTTDSCDDGDCVHTPNTKACDDGESCTGPDYCDGGTCQAGPLTCECLETSDCAPKDDGNPCNGTLVCKANECVVDPDTVVTCPDVDGCTASACNPNSGACEAVPAEDGTDCNDANPCTTAEKCTGGTCGGGIPVVCDDEVACTDDTCEPSSGCVFTPNDAHCTDGDACTVDACDANSGCTFTPKAPGDSCDTSIGCVTGTCGTPVRSPRTCEQLGWLPDFNGVDGTVCGESDVGPNGSCPGEVTWAQADALCNQAGGRLCTMQELVDGEAKGSGCGFDNARLWSSTPCGPESTWTVGGSDVTIGMLPPQCLPRSSGGVFPRCCADTADADAGMRCVPSGSSCNDDDPCTTESCSPDSDICSPQTTACPGGCCATQGQCDDGVYVDGKCFEAYYDWFTRWKEGNGLCQNKGGTLAVIRTSAQNAAVLARIKDECGDDEPAHIGLTDENTEGSFRWINGQSVGYTNWAGGEPNNSDNEDFTQMRQDGYWNDIKNDNLSCYVCSFEPEVSVGACTGCP